MMQYPQISDPADKAGDNVTKELFVREYEAELCKKTYSFIHRMRLKVTKQMIQGVKSQWT
jgi:hypothetical protein